MPDRKGKAPIRRIVIDDTPAKGPPVNAKGLNATMVPSQQQQQLQQQQQEIVRGDSLVKYDNPILVSSTCVQKQSQTEDILNSILPPREWTESGNLWVQYVSSTPATRLDVVSLREQLDRKLQEQKARETGLCPVREEIYGQCFDEIIRQVTINCAERGLLLLRVRDEIRMTVAAYQTLYESSVAFGMRKALMAQHKKSQMHAAVKQLEAEKQELSNEVGALEAKIQALKERDEERKAKDAEAHAEEVAKFTNINQQLKASLEQILAAPHKRGT